MITNMTLKRVDSTLVYFREYMQMQIYKTLYWNLFSLEVNPSSSLNHSFPLQNSDPLHDSKRVDFHSCKFQRVHASTMSSSAETPGNVVELLWFYASQRSTDGDISKTVHIMQILWRLRRKTKHEQKWVLSTLGASNDTLYGKLFAARVYYIYYGCRIKDSVGCRPTQDYIHK